MSDNNQPYVVVVGIDFEPDGDIALASALRIAASVGNSVVHVLHVERSLDTFASGHEHDSRVREVLESMTKVCNEQVEGLVAEQPSSHFKGVVTHCGGGDPATQLVQLAASLNAELVVVGSRNRKGLKRLVLGSVAERVARLAGCAVLVARPRAHGRKAEVVIEPPCPDCVAVRQSSNNEQIWCERHERAKYHPVAHRYVGGNSVRQPGKPFGATVP